jgi:hypothetical protein
MEYGPVTMILSYKHNFLFLKTAKTAGTSFEIALSKYAGKKDIVTPVFKEDEVHRQGSSRPQNYSSSLHMMMVRLGLTSSKGIFYNHIPARRVKKLVGPELFEKLLKVSITRNPYDMAVSQYFWSFRHNGDTSPDHFRQWLRTRPEILLGNRKITHIKNKNVIDFTIRFENFEEDIREFASRTGLPSSLYTDFDAIRAKGQYRPKQASTRSMFEGFEDGVAIIKEMFREDIEKYKYTPK